MVCIISISINLYLCAHISYKTDCVTIEIGILAFSTWLLPRGLIHATILTIEGILFDSNRIKYKIARKARISIGD